MVLPMTTAYGTYFRMSGPAAGLHPERLVLRHRPGRGAGLHPLTFPETFYDREALTDYINNLR